MLLTWIKNEQVNVVPPDWDGLISVDIAFIKESKGEAKTEVR